jgi:hypothetical protein
MRVEPLDALKSIVQFLALTTEEKVAYAGDGIARTSSDCAPAFGFARPALEEIAAADSEFMVSSTAYKTQISPHSITFCVELEEQS